MKPVSQIQNKIVSYAPATGEKLGEVPVFTADDVKAVVDISRKAFHSWKTTSFDERKRAALYAREIILEDIDEIADLISKESGKPFAEAISMEIAPVLDLIRYFAVNTKKLLRPKKINIGLYSFMGRRSEIAYFPYGVVGIIPAWNFPFSIPLGEAVMALMAGNSVIIKPSELTPLTGIRIGEILTKAGFPENTVHVITGGGETGAALVAAPPDKIMFTGSVATGKKIAEAAARSLTSCVLELGGKDPMIVFADADMDLAASAAVWGAFTNSDQCCASVERLYVERKAAEKLTEQIVAKTKLLKQGISGDDISVCAMSSEQQIKITEDHIRNFRESGADILTGGKRNHELGELFFEPTVIKGADNDMRAMQEETFGPTLPIAVFDTEEEAIKLANDSEFGLNASVWTKDAVKAKRVANKLETGSVCINEVMYTHGIAQTPWGGVKNSGKGRTHGTEGLMELVRQRHIHTNKLPLMPNVWWMPYSATAIATFKGLASKFTSGSLGQTASLLPLLWKRIKEIKRSGN